MYRYQCYNNIETWMGNTPALAVLVLDQRVSGEVSTGAVSEVPASVSGLRTGYPESRHDPVSNSL